MVVSSVTPLISAATFGPLLRVLREGAAHERLEDAELLGVLLGGGGHLTGGLPLLALVDEHRGVATVVEDHVGEPATGPGQDLLGAVPVLLEGLALPGEDRHALGVLGGAVRAHDDGRGGLVLGGVDVAGGPADLGTERGQRLDEHRGLHGHVQRAGDAGAAERLAVTELGAQGHQPRHLVLGKTDLVAAGLGEARSRTLWSTGMRELLGSHDGLVDPASPFRAARSWRVITRAGELQLYRRAPFNAMNPQVTNPPWPSKVWSDTGYAVRRHLAGAAPPR